MKLGKRAFKLSPFDLLNGLFMVLLCAVMIYPLLFVFGRSFMTDAERAARHFAIVPRHPDLSAYRMILSSGSRILSGYAVTLARTLIGTALNLFFTTCFAYVLSRRKYPFRIAMTAMVVFTMWFSGGLIPSFLLMRSLGLYNNFMVLVLPGLISAWNLLILRNFFLSIPESLEESARIDGANDFVVLARVIVPVSVPALATIALFYAVGHWNAWFDALIYISDKKLWPVQIFLRELIQSANATDMVGSTLYAEEMPPSQSVIFATIAVSTVPILCVYPFLQKYFVAGTMVGSLKG